MPVLKITEQTKRRINDITTELLGATRGGAFSRSDPLLVEAVGRLAGVARYLAGLDVAGERGMLTTDVEVESIKLAASKVAQEARAEGNAGEALAKLADQLIALAEQVRKVKQEQIAL
jgi:hypothetical protein